MSRSKPFRCCAWHVIAAVVLTMNSLLSGASAPLQIPALRWEERSDWINVKTDIDLTTIGDGQADDTVAIQKALSGVRDSSVLYFPPGTTPLVPCPTLG